MITVSLPVYNHPWLIRRAVDLILGQTLKDLQLVVVNDAGPSPWNRLEGIKDERLVRFDLPKNRGPYYANAVVLAATGRELFTVHDSDDWSQRDRLQVLVDHQGTADVVCDGFTRHGNNGQVTTFKPQPNLIGHQGARSLWHIAHHKGLWKTEALRTLGMGPQFRVGWDTYLMHFAALTLKVEWVMDYFGYNQERQPGSLITSPKTGPNSKLRAAHVVEMGRLWKEVQADPSRVAEILQPPEDVAVLVAEDAERLRGLL